MKQCRDCRPPYRSEADHQADRRRVKSCNWLDWMIEDGKCPHCGGLLVHLEPTPLGKLLDEMSVGGEHS